MTKIALKWGDVFIGEMILNRGDDILSIMYCLSSNTLVNWYFFAVLSGKDALSPSTILKPFRCAKLNVCVHQMGVKNMNSLQILINVCNSS